MNYMKEIDDYIEIEKNVLHQLDREKISEAISLLLDVLEREGTVYFFGNGGSASTASHYVNDLNKGVSEGLEKKFRCVCLSDNIATITAISNDISYEECYREQLVGRLKKEDLVVGISGSGNSPNVVHAVEYAKEQGVVSIGLTGYNGGKLGEICDCHIHAKVNSMQISEDIHLILDHMIMSILCRHLKGEEHLSNV